MALPDASLFISTKMLFNVKNCLFSLARKHFSTIALLALTATTAGALSSCADIIDDGKRTVVVSIEPLHYVADALATDNYTIEVLTPAGASPETYQPTPKQVMHLEECRGFVRVGTLGFERTLVKRLTDNVPHLSILDASQDIRPISIHDGEPMRPGPLHLHGQHPEVPADSDSTLAPPPAGAHAHGHGHPHEIDPHTWMSPQNLKRIAHRLYMAFADANPETDRPEFQARYDAFTAKMDSVDREIRKLVAVAPTHAFVVYHPALGYFAHEYGFKQLYIQQDGKEPSAAQMAELIEKAREAGVKVVFVQKEYSSRAAETLAKEIGARIEVIDPLSYDVPQLLIGIARALAES